VHDTVRKPSVISISWGGPEVAWTAKTLKGFDQLFQSAAKLGVTIAVAAGDDGSSDGVSDGHAHVDFPASSPFALATGGTELHGSGTTVQQEIVWNNSTSGNGATGGGISDFFKVPSYQSGVPLPKSLGKKPIKGRGSPDIAGNASPVTAYQIFVGGKPAKVGGTSAVAPLWAGLIALFNQALQQPVGFLNPLLYALPAQRPLRDITEGNNDPGGVGGYDAGAGWDAATGWGTPDGKALLAALQGKGTP
jgi:kumamolisin